MPVPIERQYTLEEYFSVEEISSVKHEFYQGQIFAMAGASLRHSRITGNLFTMLRAALDNSPCEVFASDLRVRTPGGLYTYPDVMIVCGGVQLSAADRLDTVVNPTAIVEVLSASTAAYDRGEKFRLYRGFPTLRDYLLVDQSVCSVEHFVRPENASGDWPRRAYRLATDIVTLASVRVPPSLAGVYAGVDISRSGA